MRPPSRSLRLTTLSVIAAAVLTGCATEGTRRGAQVCPQCRTVLETDNTFSRSRWDSRERFPEVRSEHRCPGCQGPLASLFREGKWQHQCSICEQSAFSCPISHR